MHRLATIAVASSRPLALPALATARTSRTPAADRSPVAQAGALIGLVTAPAVTGGPATLPVADLIVTATGPAGIRYTTTTGVNGWYDLEQLPPGSYALTIIGACSGDRDRRRRAPRSVPAASPRRTRN